MGIKQQLGLAMGAFLACSAAQAALVTMTQNVSIDPGLASYSGNTIFPLPHQACGPPERNYFEADEKIRIGIQISLKDLDASDFDNPSHDSTVVGAVAPEQELVWQVGWYNPSNVLIFIDTLVLCWSDDPGAECQSGSVNVKPLVDAANASSSNPQALNLGTGDGIYAWLGGMFDVGTWEARTFFDATSELDFFDQTFFRVPLVPAWLLMLPGFVWLVRRKASV